MSPTIRFSSATQPFWSFHPHCLFCNYDAGEWIYAAHCGPRPTKKKHPMWHTRFEFVAWLCEDCATYADRVEWFIDTVLGQYPDATFVSLPGSTDESEMPPTKRKFLAEHQARKRR